MIALMLCSNFCSCRFAQDRQDRARHIFKTRGVALRELDGSVYENKERRNYLFEMARRKDAEPRNYPQFFAESPDGTTEWLGDYYSIIEWNDAEDTPPNILIPKEMTFTEKFSNFKSVS